ncbi:MAG: hypothetical protein ACYTGX_14125 [Planctomycetota bacterium]|jgi:tetratricopeptide (TPR) repeat protein
MLSTMTAAVVMAVTLVAPWAPAEKVRLKSGKVVEVTVTDVDGDSVGVRFVEAERIVTARYRADQLDPRSWVKLRSPRIGDDPGARLRLAEFCLDHGLFALADRELNRVGDAVPDAAERLAALRKRQREGAAAQLLKLAEQALAKGRAADARGFLDIVLTRYRDTAAISKADALLAKVEERLTELRKSQAVATVSEAQAKVRASIAKKLAPARARLDRAGRTNLAGLRAPSVGAAVKAFTRAAGDAARAAADLQALERRYSDDPVLRKAILAAHRDAVAFAVRAYLNLGSAELVRGSYPQALLAANRAIALAPEDRWVWEFRARVELAAAESAGRVGRIR